MSDEDYQKGQADADVDCEKKLKEIRDHLNELIKKERKPPMAMTFGGKVRLQTLTQLRDWLEEEYGGDK